MADTGKSCALLVPPIAGFNAGDSQATTLEVSGGDDVQIDGMESLKVHPGLAFTGKTAAREA